MPRRTSKTGFPSLWLTRSPGAWLLWPFSLLFRMLAWLRRKLLVPQRLPVPVVVVGGITVGGAGKTPLTLALIEALRNHGFNPGVVSRGYGGKVVDVVEVQDDSIAAEVGDEPLLLRQRAECPVFVGADRVAAGHALLSTHPDVDLLFADDGLQHYRLARDFEIVVLDRRGLGNGWCLPAGPLREPPSRLAETNALVLNQAPLPHCVTIPAFDMRLEGSVFYRLHAPQTRVEATALRGLRLHAVAGIGAPERFFDHLQALGLACELHPFPDHHGFCREELVFDGGTILTTEKDAVKLRSILGEDAEVWVLPVSAVVPEALVQLLVEKVHGRTFA